GTINGLDEVRIWERVILLDTTIRFCWEQTVMYEAPGLTGGTLQCSSTKVYMR
ncbi:hypothetical protein J1N35_014110, partial [Gossypium stocksii]